MTDYLSGSVGHMMSDRGVYMTSLECRVSKSVSEGEEKAETVSRGGNTHAESLRKTREGLERWFGG